MARHGPHGLADRQHHATCVDGEDLLPLLEVDRSVEVQGGTTPALATTTSSCSKVPTISENAASSERASQTSAETVTQRPGSHHQATARGARLVDHRSAGSGFGEHPHDRGPDAARPSGNDGHPPGQQARPGARLPPP